MPCLLYCVTQPKQILKMAAGVCEGEVQSHEMLGMQVYWSEIANPEACLGSAESLKKAALQFHQVLREILATATPIPFRFPTLLESEDGIEQQPLRGVAARGRTIAGGPASLERALASSRVHHSARGAWSSFMIRVPPGGKRWRSRHISRHCCWRACRTGTTALSGQRRWPSGRRHTCPGFVSSSAVGCWRFSPPARLRRTVSSRSAWMTPFSRLRPSTSTAPSNTLARPTPTPC